MRKDVERVIDTIIPDLLKGGEVVLDDERWNKFSIADCEEVYFRFGVTAIKQGKQKICFRFEQV